MIEVKTRPYAHQALELETHTWDPARALWWEMRTGKTKVLLDQAQTLWQYGEIDALLVLAPRRNVVRNWATKEAPAHLAVPNFIHAWDGSASSRAWHRRAVDTLIGADSSRTLPVFVVTFDGILSRACSKMVAKFVRVHRCMVVFDESHHLKKPAGSKARRARALAKRCPYRRIATGTGIANSPLSLWGQLELLEPGASGYSRYGEFKNRYAIYADRRTRGGRTYPELVAYTNLGELRSSAGRWGTVVLRSECEDMPEIVTTRYTLDPHAETKRVIAELRETLEAQTRGGLVTVVDGSLVAFRARQALSGWVGGSETDPSWVELFPIDECPRLAALEEVLVDHFDAGETHVVVWAAFRQDVERVVGFLKNKKLAAAYRYHGQVRPKERDRALTAFQTPAGPRRRVMVATPWTLGEGIPLAPARSAVWFSHPWDWVARSQADSRCVVTGGPRVSLTLLEATGTMDTRVLDGLEERRDLSSYMIGEGLRSWLQGNP